MFKILNWLFGKKKSEETQSDLPTKYEWYNHCGIDEQELLDMATHRRNVVIPSLIKFLEPFVGPNHRLQIWNDSIHSDRINIIENFGDGYIVGSICIRGHSNIMPPSFNSGGPRVICPNCGVSTRYESKHHCNKSGFGDVEINNKTIINSIESNISNISEQIYKLQKELSKLEIVENSFCQK